MAVETYKEKINRSTDWGGDASTGNLPVNGQRVQEFIKEELNSKVGDIYLDNTTSRYLCFANEDDREEYLSTGNEDLIIGTFNAVSNYAVYIENTTKNLAVLATSTGNQLSYRFKVVDIRTEQNTGEDVKCTYTFTNTTAGSVRTFSEDLKSAADAEGWTNRVLSIDDYLEVGTNSITIKIVGQSSYALSQIGVGFEMVDLRYSPSFDYSKTWKDNQQLTLQYSITCAKPKVIETYVDGVHLTDYDRTIQAVTGGDYIYIPITDLESGIHSLQTRAYITTDNGMIFYSKNYYYQFIVDKGDYETPSVVLHKVIEDGSLIDSLSLETQQFETISFEWGYYDPQNRSLAVSFYYDDTLVTSIQKNNSDDVDTFTYRPSDAGSSTIKININDEFEAEVPVDVEVSSTALAETTDGLILKLSAMGRSNEEPEESRETWEYFSKTDNKTYTTTFSGFAWNNLQGWADNCLVLSDGAQITVDINPMSRDWTVYGGTVEIDVETFDIEDDDAVIMSCEGTGGNNYFRLTATSAKLKTSGSNAIENRFRDNERQKIAFIVNSAKKGDADTREDANLIYIVTNGVLERAINFSSSDSMSSNAKLVIGNTDGKVKCKIHSIRVYNRAISVDEEFNNYVIDSDDIQALYDRNDILDDAAENVVYSKIVNKIPVLIFTGPLPALMAKADKTIKESYDIQYTNNFAPERNFTAFHVETKLQGTSSLGYPRKNFKIKTKNKGMKQSTFDASDYVFDNDTSSPYYRRLCYKETGLPLSFEDSQKLSGCYTFTYDGKIAENGKLQVKSNTCMPVDVWTLKADYMESSSSHNTGVARMWNDIMKNVRLTDTGTYISSAKEVDEPSEISSQDSYVCRTEAQKVAEAYNTGEVRTTVDGFPIVAFYRLDYDSPLVFMGQYNFNNDKGSEEMFGFKDIKVTDADGNTTKKFDGSVVECWENLQNTNEISLFIYEKYFGTEWADCFEARYPEDPQKTDPVTGEITSDGYVLENLHELSDWIASTRHDPEDIPRLKKQLEKYEVGSEKYNRIEQEIKDLTIDSSNTIHIDSDFAKKINNYQYAYTQVSDGSSTYVPDVYHYTDTGDYPDTEENRQKKFEVEKWEHFDVWKLAGYYIYLIRYGAVDQFVKNSMLETEGVGKFGGKYKKWFFINYDNDCVFGLRNNGELAFGYDMDRNTVDPAYTGMTEDELFENDVDGRAMMGYRSTLWNNLEADEEFMRMVRALDNAMAQVGLNYDSMNEMFDTNQVDQWCERIYNANERYKYIAPYTNDNVNNLTMLQGTRKSHRHWWLSNRMEYYDAKWISGDYRSKILEIKADAAQAGKVIAITPGADFYYAWGTNSALIESNVQLDPNSEDESKHSYKFISNMSMVQGDPIRVYAINKIATIDISDYGSGIFNVNFANIAGDTTHELRKVWIGNADTWVKNNIVNSSLNNIDTVANCPNLEYLDITNCSKITSLNAASNTRLSTLRAKGTSLTSFAPYAGSKIELAELPTSINVLSLDNIQLSSLDNISYTPNRNLRSLTLKNSSNAGITMAYYYKFVEPWIQILKNAYADGTNLYSSAELTLSNIKWSFGDIQKLYDFAEFIQNAKTFDISGTIDLRSYGSLTIEDLAKCRELFGEGCFNQTNKIYIIAPMSNFVKTRNGNDYVVAGQETEFYCEIYPEAPASYSIVYTIATYNSEDGVYTDITDIEKQRAGISITNKKNSDGEYIGILKTTENVINADTHFLIRAHMTVQGGDERNSRMEFTIYDPTYPSTASTIEGDTSIYTNPDKREEMGDERTLVYTLKPLTSGNTVPIGTYDVKWSINGDGIAYVNTEQSAVNPENQLEYILVTMPDSQPEISARLNFYADITPTNGSFVRETLSTLVLNENVIITTESNPVVMKVCYDNGWAANEDALTKDEAEAITDFGTAFSGITSAFSFTELPYFTGITSIADNAFRGSYLEEIIIPDAITSIGTYAFADCRYLTNVKLSSTIGEISEGMFANDVRLSDIEIPSGITTINSYAFGNTNIEYVCVAESTEEEYLNDSPMYDEKFHPYYGTKRGLIIHEGLTEIDDNVFGTSVWRDNYDNYNKLKMIEFPISLTKYGEDVVRGWYLEMIYVRPANKEYISIDGVLYNKNQETLFRYPAAKSDVEDFTPSNVYRFGAYAFYRTTGLNSVTMLNNFDAQGMGVYCFAYSSISKIDMSLSNNLSVLPTHAFYSCKNLTDVIFPTQGSLKIIRDFIFAECTSLESIDFPEGLEWIGNGTSANYFQNYAETFNNCSSLKHIYFPDSVTSFGSRTVYRCNALEELVFPPFIELGKIVLNMVGHCANLKYITLPVFSYDTEGEYQVLNSEGVAGETVYYSYDEALSAAGNDESKVLTIKEVEDVIYNSTIREANNNWQNLPSVLEYRLSSKDNGKHAFIEDGVLYFKDNDGNISLIKAPNSFSEVTINEDIISIDERAFYYMPYLSKIYMFTDTLPEITSAYPIEETSTGNEAVEEKVLYVSNGIIDLIDRGIYIRRGYIRNIPVIVDTESDIENKASTAYFIKETSMIQEYDENGEITFTSSVYEGGNIPFFEIMGGGNYYYDSDGEEFVELDFDTTYAELYRMWREMITRAGYTAKYYEVNNTIYLTISAADSSSVVYLGDFPCEYNEELDKWVVYLSGVPNKKELDLFIDGTKYSSVVIDKDITEYTVAQRMMMMRSFLMTSATSSDSTDSDTITLSKYQYDILNSKINQINAKLNEIES